MRMEDQTRMIACMSYVIRIALSIIETIICKAKSIAITVKILFAFCDGVASLPVISYWFIFLWCGQSWNTPAPFGTLHCQSIYRTKLKKFKKGPSA